MKRYVAGTPIIVVTRFSLDQLERPRRVERRLEHDRRALPPREQRLHVPAADVELRQHLQDDVVVAGAPATRSKERFVQKQFACVSSAPFGFPVVPEV